MESSTELRSANNQRTSAPLLQNKALRITPCKSEPAHARPIQVGS